MPKQMQTAQGGLFESALAASLPPAVQERSATLLRLLLLEAITPHTATSRTSKKEVCHDKNRS